ncbi:MAG TPA: universal stress protein [Solirubrobacteraceae bacterium]|nr:universal stress protein [Solirubrobacteraceae bacterium]
MTCSEPHRILVGYDGSRASRAALAWAEATARERNACLTVVTVMTPAWYGACWPGISIAPTGAELERAAAKLLHEAIDQLAPDLSVTSRILAGPVGAALAKAARCHDCDVIVLGRPRRALRPWPSPIERYLRRHCDIPVIPVTVPGQEAMSPAPAPEPSVPATIHPAI